MRLIFSTHKSQITILDNIRIIRFAIMKLLKLWRTFKEGFVNFFRNGWLSFATISVLAISLYIISVTFFIWIMADVVLKSIEEKINISVYFQPEVSEEEVLEIKGVFAGIEGVKSVEYVSKNQAFDEFKNLGESDPSIKKALELIGENPLLSSLVIRAHSSEKYESIDQAVQNAGLGEKINRISYKENKDSIERFNSIIKIIKEIGLALGVIFVAVAVMITFNTIRITIYSHKQEFEIMRLVGASNLYVEMPYVFEGIFYGISASIVSIIALFGTVKFMSSFANKIVPGYNLVSYYLDHLLLIFSSLVVLGIILGIISSFIAIRRYLKI